MQRLIDDAEGVSVLASRTSEVTGIPADHIEKDFWVTETLRGVTAHAAEHGVPVLFKGGTSLSKAFKLIRRFSEDVDLLVVLPQSATEGARDRMLKDFVGAAAAATGLEPQPDSTSATRGVKRSVRLHYRQSEDFGLSRGVLLELGSRGGTLPHVDMPIMSLICEHLPDEIAGFEEAAPFNATVLAPVRTLAEKLVLLHTASVEERPVNAVRTARHYYDVFCLLGAPVVQAELNTGTMAMLAREVTTHSEAWDLPAAPRPDGGFAASPAFTNGAHLPAVAEEFERRVLGALVWPGAVRPTFEACVARVRESSHLL